MEAKLKAIKQEIIDINKKDGIVKTYINSFNIKDIYSEVSLPGSFKKTFSENLKNIYWLKNHDWDVMPGVTKELIEDGKGAIAIGQINMKKQMGVDLWNDYLLYAEHGRSLEHSIRTQPIKYTIEDDVMYISEQKISEWSTLTRPGANPNTEVISLKYQADEMALLRDALKLDYSDEKLKNIENKINDLETLIIKAAEGTLIDKPIDEKFIKTTINSINNIKF